MGDHRLFSISVLVSAAVLQLFLWDSIGALKCRTEDGPNSEEVRKVIRTCMRRITSETKNKSNEGFEDEYGNYDSSYSDTESNDKGESNVESNVKRGGDNPKTTRQRNGDDRKSGRDSGRSNDEKRRDQNWDYNDRTANDRRNPYGRYKRQYYNDGNQGSYGYQQNDRYNRDRNSFMSSSSVNNTSNVTNNVERDRACLMQCFFQEMKMTNSEGFPDKHKVLHVVTKDLRDNELRDFYTDSIQECFHMISMDSRNRDKCGYSMKFVICLADRGQANCNDWENETILF